MSKWKDKQFLAENMREYRKKNPEKMKSIDLKKKYGISLEDYQNLLKIQNHVCAICHRPENCVDYRTGLPRALAVDHCHTTLRVRGLLCTQCNRGLGKFHDNVQYLASAITYLTKA